MTDLAKKKEEIKKIILSLLLSAPVGLTVEELERDYHLFIGGKLPVRELGYSNTEELLLDIPDTVKLTRNNGKIVLKGVSSDSTKNIEKLVSKQKLDTRKHWGALDRSSNRGSASPSRWNPSHMSQPAIQVDSWRSDRKRLKGSPYVNWGYMPPSLRLPPRLHQQKQAKHRNMPSVPAYIQGLIYDLVMIHPEGLPLTHFGTIFQKKFSVPLDFWHLGFCSLFDLLASMSDIVILKQLSAGETWVLSAEVASQHYNLPPKYSLTYDRSETVDIKPLLEATVTEKSHPDTVVSCAQITEKSPPDNLVNHPPVTEKSYSETEMSHPPVTEKSYSETEMGHPPVTEKSYSEKVISHPPITEKPYSVTEMNHPPVTEKSYSEKVISHPPVTEKSHTEQVMSPEVKKPVKKEVPAEVTSSMYDRITEPDLYVTKNIPAIVQDNIQEMMISRLKGIYASRFSLEYKKSFQRDLPYKSCGYNSVIEFVSDLPHIIRVERPHPEGDWHLLPVSAQCSPETNKVLAKNHITDNQISNISVSQSVKEAIFQVLCMHPDGIPLHNFENVFKKMTGKDLEFEKYGAICLKQFLHSTPDILCISINASDKPIVCLKSSDEHRRFDKLLNQYQPTVVSKSQMEESMLYLPVDTVSPGCFYTSQALPHFADDAHYIELYVSYVISPAVFWIQLRGRKTTLALEDLMDDIEATYKHLTNKYDMKASLAKPGMVCAVIYPEDGFWYRGIITGLKEQLFEVYYVDYGNVCYVSISQIKFLKTKFMKLPAQAIQARLSNIKPVDQEWAVSSKNRILALSRGKPLVGLVTNDKDGVLSLCLTDTSQEDDIHINDVLVQEGYAVFSPDSETVEVTTHSHAPSRELLYGKPNVTSNQNNVTSKQNTVTSSQDNSVVTPTNQRHVRQVQMTDGLIVSLINLGGNLYILSSELSSIFSDRDINAQLSRDKVTVTREKYPSLFSELELYDVPNVKDVLRLFSFSSLPLMIELYGGKRKDDIEELKGTALDILQWFDPDDPYWKGVDDESEVTDEVDTQSSGGDSTDTIHPDDLQHVYHSLDTRRKKLLNDIMSASRCTPEVVNELNEVELSLKRIEALITKLKNDQDENGAGTSSGNRLLQNQSGQDLSQGTTFQVNESMILANRATSHATGAMSQVSGTTSQIARATAQAAGAISQLPGTSSQTVLPVTISELKSIQKVAPMIQTLPMKQDTPATSVGSSALSALEMSTLLLQRQLLMNKMLLERSGLSQEMTNAMNTFGQQPQQQCFGRGSSFQQQIRPLGLQQAPPSSVTMVTHAVPNPVFSLGRGNTLLQGDQPTQETQLLQQINLINSRLTALSVNSTTSDSLPTSQLSGFGSSTNHLLSGQQDNHGQLMQIMGGNLPRWFNPSGSTALVNLPTNYNPQPCLSVADFGALASVNSPPQGFVSDALMQDHHLQQPSLGFGIQPDLIPVLQFMGQKGGAVFPCTSEPGSGL